ncbi:MAG TPA: hypothetical protein VFW11_22410 [Cyclobacteriaceae bacterium]|nr:hypothetical protein [Cyclobacteriaceae bacterium]
MATEIDIVHVNDPYLEFGGVGEFIDPKEGLKQGGPFDLRFGTARKRIANIGFVGSEAMIAKGIKWFEHCQKGIKSGMTNIAQYPDFPGFEEVFRCKMEFNPRWNYIIDDEHLENALSIRSRQECFKNVLALFSNGLEHLSKIDTIKPDVIICCLSEKIVERCWSITNEKVKREDRKKIKALANQLSLFETFDKEPIEEQQEDILNRDFRRALKAKAMRFGIPIQIGRDTLFLDLEKNQDASIRAWNSNIALYYKAGGIPWRIRKSEVETCYVGISFHHLYTTHGKHLVRSCIAQAFSSEGEGFAIRGVNVPWTEDQDRNVHLTREQAGQLGEKILAEYRYRTGTTPLRIVLHKSTAFDINEKEGLYESLNNVPIVELIHLAPTKFRLVRFGVYPALRGTLCRINNDASYLFTTGFMKSLGTYPGPHIPVPVQINVDQDREIDIVQAASDVIALSRMNWNTASITGGHPVTLLFSRRVGGIMAEFGDEEPPSSFRFYV